MALASVDLPAPLGPSTTAMLPASAATETPSRTGGPSYPATIASARRTTTLPTANLLHLWRRGGLDAEVRSNDFGVSANVIETATSEHLSLGHNHDIVSDHRKKAHVVCDYQNRHLLVDDLLDSIRDEYR